MLSTYVVGFLFFLHGPYESFEFRSGGIVCNRSELQPFPPEIFWFHATTFFKKKIILFFSLFEGAITFDVSHIDQMLPEGALERANISLRDYDAKNVSEVLLIL